MLSIVLDLGLGKVIRSEVMHTSYLLMLVHAIVIVVSSGAYKYCEITPTLFVVYLSPSTRENKARSISSKNSIVEAIESIRERSQLKHHLRMEALGYPVSIKLPN